MEHKGYSYSISTIKPSYDSYEQSNIVRPNPMAQKHPGAWELFHKEFERGCLNQWGPLGMFSMWFQSSMVLLRLAARNCLSVMLRFGYLWWAAQMAGAIGMACGAQEWCGLHVAWPRPCGGDVGRQRTKVWPLYSTTAIAMTRWWRQIPNWSSLAWQFPTATMPMRTWVVLWLGSTSLSSLAGWPRMASPICLMDQ